MKLLPNWWEVIARAWSVRFLALAAMMTGLEVGFPYFQPHIPLPEGLFGALSGLFSAAALVARIIAQDDLKEGGDDAEHPSA
jgi:hypothetical protein|tara:strand:+ start:1884 stop:2129 length:246 start_codon:yes stop_codon:yes gene_type:complete